MSFEQWYHSKIQPPNLGCVNLEMIFPTAKLSRVTALCSCVQLLVMCLPYNKSVSVRCAEITPANVIKQARSLMKDHRYTQADTLLSALVKAYPHDAYLAMARGDLLREIGKVGEASGEFARAAKLVPSNPFPLIALAQLSLKQLEMELALSYAEQAVVRDPHCLPARLELVDVLLQRDQTREAERQMRSIPADSRGKAAVEELAYRLSLRKGDFSGARSHLQNAINGREVGRLQLRIEQSELLQSMGDNNAARAELEKVIMDDPNSLLAWLALARLLETQYHDYASALSNYDEALRLDPLSSQAIAGHDRCQLKRRNIALQIKIALHELWTNLAEDDASLREACPSPPRKH